jgi:Na+/H+-dicarboxylate symporter
MKNRNRLTVYILSGLVLGVVVGYFVNANSANPASFSDFMSLISTLFLRLIKMIIAPLVFSTLVVGIARMGDTREVGRIGIKALGWFVIASVISLSLGLVLVNLFRPGDALALTNLVPAAGTASGIVTSSLTLKEFITHLVPSSIVDGMARNEILQIVIFSIFFGTGAAAVGERAKPLIDAIDGIAHIMLKVTGYVMNSAPIAVFAAVSGIVAKSGPACSRPTACSWASSTSVSHSLWIILPCSASCSSDRASSACWSNCASRPCWRFPPPLRKRRSRKRSKAWSASACATGSQRSCCRSVIRSTSMAR